MTPQEVSVKLRQALGAWDAATNGRLEEMALHAFETTARPEAIRTLLDALSQAQAEGERLREDAERYALLRRKVCIIGAFGKDAAFHILNLDPVADWKNDNASTILDAAIDAARASLSRGVV